MKGEGLYRFALRCHPRAFRERYEDEMLECYRDGWREAPNRAAYFLRAIASAVVVGLRQRRASTPARTTGTPSQSHARLDSWEHDVRYALRRIVRKPGLSLLVVLTLGLGLGANTAVFSVMHSVLLEPLPFEDSDALVRIYAHDREERGDWEFLSAPAVLDLRANAATLSGIAILENYSVRGADITGGDRPERARALRVSADYFEVLRISPVLGRGFGPEDENEASRVVVVSERIWRRHLDGTSHAVGATLPLDGVAHRVIGVVSDTFEDPLEGIVDLWLPMDTTTAAGFDWDNHYLSAIARLEEDATLEQARAELEVLAERHWTLDDQANDRYRVLSLKSDVVGPADDLLKALMGAVAVLLLLTAVNVTGLLVAQTASRARELALRSALGSGQSALVRQLVVEAGLLAALGAVAGILLGRGALQALVALAPSELPRRSAIVLPAEALLLSALLAVLLGLAIGLVVAVSSSRPGLGRSLVAGAGNIGESPRRRRMRDALVVSELALAVVLLMGAFVLVTSFERLRSVDLGIEREAVTAFQVNLPNARYPDGASRQALYDRLESEALALPGVAAIGSVSYLPASGSYHSWGTRRAYDIDRPVDEANIQTDQRIVDGDYFEVLGVALQRGRLFDARDGADAPRRVLVSASLASRLFPDEDPIGQYIRVAGFYPRIIGVVEDTSVSARGDVVPKVYHHHAQFAEARNWRLHQVVRTRPGAGDTIAALRAALTAIDPELVLHDPRAMDDVVGGGVTTERFAMILLGAFALIAMLLASLGLYGVLSHAVVQRRREIGVRMALGARPKRIRRMVVGRGLVLSLWGAIAGGIVAFISLGALESFLFGVDARDPRIAAVTLLVFVFVAVVASYLPARAATRVDPVEAFRAE